MIELVVEDDGCLCLKHDKGCKVEVGQSAIARSTFLRQLKHTTGTTELPVEEKSFSLWMSLETSQMLYDSTSSTLCSLLEVRPD
jgi:hypothetical protein